MSTANRLEKIERRVEQVKVMQRESLRCRAIREIVREWRVRQSEYQNAMVKTKPPHRARYEGIMTGTRWCVEDLEKILNE